MTYNEIDPFACDWLTNLANAGEIPAGTIDRRSIKELTGDDCNATTHFFAGVGGWPLALRLAGWPDNRPIWTGSCPCQPFSQAGKRKGTGDDRHLWPEMFRLIGECRPPIVVGEQVASKDGLGWLDGVFADLEGAGYACGAVDLCAAGVGAPHIRQRLFWVGIADGGIVQRIASAGEQPVHEFRGGFGGGLGPRRASIQANGHGSAAVAASGTDPWSDYRIIPCADGKHRRISAQSCIFRMADGVPASVGCDESWLCGMAENSSTNGAIDGTAKTFSGSEDMLLLRSSDGAEDVRESPRMSGEFQEASLLQPDLHGERHGGENQDDERPQQPSPVLQESEGCVRNLQRIEEDVACPSQGREWLEQQRRKFGYIVRSLPSSLSFAKLHGHGQEAEALSSLREAILSRRPLRDAQATEAEIWRSFNDEEKDGVIVRFGASASVIFSKEPLAYGVPVKVGPLFARLVELGHSAKDARRIIREARRNRVGRLRGYGNAIVPHVSAEFLRMVMEVTT